MLISGESNKNDDIMDNILISIKDDLVSENEDISFSDEESETSPKKALEKVTIENMTLPVIRLTPGMLTSKLF